ncbi:MAG: type VI secretion system tube protein Hcp [Marmoricola sp.]
MAMDMFLKIDGVLGESADQTHAGEIDVLAWSFGAANSGSTHLGSGAGAGKVNVQDLSLTKYVDKSSPLLMLACCNGRHNRTATLAIRKAGEKPFDYLVMEMTDVLVSSVSVGGSGGEDRLTENVTLNFARFKYSYTQQEIDGSTDTPVSMSWNIAAHM